MKRRTFLKTTSVSGLACALPPFFPFPTNDEYTTEELMGKAKVELFGEGINLRKAAHDSFLEMKKAAYSAGFDIKIVSSFRDFYRQEGIWERKYLSYTEDERLSPLKAIDKIIEYSTIPGTSRHHWGTDIDIIDGYPKASGDVLVPRKFENGGPYEGLKLWLDENSEKFGFYLVYTNDPRRRGFKYEPWHYSYAPISIPMLTAYRRLNVMKLLLQEEFLGIEHFTAGFVRTYVQDHILDINPKLL
ncbi:D-alanyl-D-alanine carboxypeptidase family protein [Flagellimonas taeanensis]|uniref:M15 family metallopeptidase n=1 Tax=Flavobacteriaceae TaxID=49546 RepID=UPI000E69C4E9|nr:MULTISPECIES: M15 family metallopeptidase [Allomuricauda]MDC6384338.1 M15 family metallopeptidase [Muricauda sp. SK9]RIV49689.1 D-alanyl-D-alanine carboxypeptidase family protein [Allomuricauda taeanensis]RIV53888.1 D-alanyl-D-alanine carboxypeptidase family protein [Allomuricauda taeanensis]